MANPTTPIRNKEENRPTGTGGASATERVSQTASSLTDKAKDVASSAAHNVGEAASSATQTARDVASNVGQKAEDATTTVGGTMRSLAGQIRENLPHEGVMGTASSAVADTLDRGGRYLEEEGLRGIGEDLTNLIRRNPIPALLIGIGVGYLIARSMRS